jgi:hypothetical protein
MSSASDISNLFQMLGVSPSHYQELERTEQVQGSRGRWAMQTGPLPADIAQPDAARDAEAVAPTDAAETAPAEPAPLIESTATAAEPDAVPQSQTESEQPIQQPVLQPAAEPVSPSESAPREPGSLSAMFARLRESNSPQQDGSQRQTS